VTSGMVGVPCVKAYTVSGAFVRLPRQHRSNQESFNPDDSRPVRAGHQPKWQNLRDRLHL
jgi:hypothetical protein